MKASLTLHADNPEEIATLAYLAYGIQKGRLTDLALEPPAYETNGAPAPEPEAEPEPEEPAKEERVEVPETDTLEAVKAWHTGHGGGKEATAALLEKLEAFGGYKKFSDIPPADRRAFVDTLTE